MHKCQGAMHKRQGAQDVKTADRYLRIAQIARKSARQREKVPDEMKRSDCTAECQNCFWPKQTVTGSETKPSTYLG